MSRVLIQAQHRLGQVDLPIFFARTEDEEPDTFAWADIAAKDVNESRQNVDSLETQLAAQKELVSQLQSQLDSIVQAKAEHEGALLHKFTELINSKKVKIRDQQRLLAAAKVDPDACEYYIPRSIPATFIFNPREIVPYPTTFTLSHTLTDYSGAHSTSHIPTPQSRDITFFEAESQRPC